MYETLLLFQVQQRLQEHITETFLLQLLGIASDWSLRVGNLLRPIRSTTQIWVVTRHQYGISAVGRVASRNVGYFFRQTPTSVIIPFEFMFFPQGTEDKSLLAGYVAMFLEKYNTAQVCGLDTQRLRSHVLVVCG